ncbi:DMT family transporter [Adlercreutzia sp. R21]|uniref:DMT family transporter n=1 Tax=Adlercreutzia wanghongyangiae TaxID=3111451 RepID=UPI002DB951C7|nr:DMT family transporter [Adlercreutzia sp. R21]MEC4183824.1 DMT family transporter [Adlercreutzia sp. R21]
MKAHVLAALTVFVWGITFVSTKVLLVDFAPVWILFVRFALGFLALCCARPHLLRLQERHHERLFALAGLAGVACYFLMENVALTFTSATAVGVIVATSPLFCALMSWARGNRGALTVRFVVGFALAMAGIALVSFASGGAIGGSPLANLAGCGLALGAALVWAAYSTIVARIAEAGYETLASTKRIFAWGLLFMLPALPFGGPLPNAAALADPVNLANLAFLGLGASAACFATWGFAVKHLGAVTTSTYIYLVPAVTAVTSVIVLGEPFTAPIAAGLVLTIAGLVLSNRP